MDVGWSAVSLYCLFKMSHLSECGREVPPEIAVILLAILCLAPSDLKTKKQGREKNSRSGTTGDIIQNVRDTKRVERRDEKASRKT